MSATLAPTLSSPTLARARLSPAGVIRAETGKLFSLRSTYWLLASVMACFVGLTLLFFTVGVVESKVVGGADLARMYLMGVAPGQMVVVVIGALAITGEYSTGSIRSTLTAVPRRTGVLVAKALVVAGLTAAVTTVSLLAAVGLSWLMKGEVVVHLDAAFWRTEAVGVAFMTAVALMTLGLGFLLRATPGTICAGLGVLLILPVLLVNLLGRYDWAVQAYRYTPTAAYDALTGGESVVPLLGPGAAAGVLAAWALVPLVAGAVRLARTDA